MEKYKHLGYAKYESKYVGRWIDQLIQEIKAGNTDNDKIIERLLIIKSCGDDAIKEIDNFIEEDGAKSL